MTCDLSIAIDEMWYILVNDYLPSNNPDDMRVNSRLSLCVSYLKCMSHICVVSLAAAVAGDVNASNRKSRCDNLGEGKNPNPHSIYFPFSLVPKSVSPLHGVGIHIQRPTHTLGPQCPAGHTHVTHPMWLLHRA